MLKLLWSIKSLRCVYLSFLTIVFLLFMSTGFYKKN